jgi:hypothetical protein
LLLKSRPSLYVAISYHGFGHIAQTAPVVNELRRRFPALQVWVQCAAPREVLVPHFHGEFEHLPEAPDIGMVMGSSLDVSAAESYAAYTAFHRDWGKRVTDLSERLRTLRPSLVFANVPYLPCAAAAAADIPSAALCSLNWAEIFQPYCGAMTGGDAIHRQIRSAYGQAELFLNPEPSMPMHGLANLRPIGPIARRGVNRRNRINEQLGLKPGEKLVLIFMGGIQTILPLGTWCSLPGINFLVAGSDCPKRPDMFPLGSLGLPYIDVLCSLDALITKPGYGSVAEAACNGVPVLYVKRHWPEEPFLVQWLHTHGQCLELSREDLERGQLMASLYALWEQPQKPFVASTGAAEAANLLDRYLR